MFLYIVLISLMLVFILMVIMILVMSKKSSENILVTSYECGFSLMSGNRLSFSLRFFLVAVLFLVFDMEVVLMLSLPFLNNYILSFFVLMVFIMLLLLGLLYEMNLGSLEWVKIN